MPRSLLLENQPFSCNPLVSFCVLKRLILTMFATALVAFREHHSRSAFSFQVVLMSGLFLRHRFQTRELFHEYSIRTEMDVLQGCTVIKSHACFRFGEMDVCASRGMLHLIFLCTRSNTMRPFPQAHEGREGCLLLIMKLECMSQLRSLIKPEEPNCGRRVWGLTA